MMQDYFYTLVERLTGRLQGAEVLTCSLHGEDSDFVRLNRNRVRQAGHVTQQSLSLDLIEGQRHAAGHCDLAGELSEDLARLETLLRTLRAQRRHLPVDPHLNYATESHSSEQYHDNELPEGGEAIATLIRAAEGLDLVGIWAAGTISRGFANSLGQRNWHSSATFNLDWSCYHARDKAVKSNYAGFHWQPQRLEAKLEAARTQLAILARPARSVTPGRYRAYLAPAAVREILDMLAWGGFGLKSQRTAQSPLQKMILEGRALHPAVSLHEDNVRGLEPRFTESGFIKPERVELIERGVYRDSLVGARSAKEYGAPVNSSGESPKALEMAAGSLADTEMLERLDLGLYLNNLWYCNFSDRNDCRITGMTRFACFWVEQGKIQAPLDVMRFDDSVYRMLGDALVDLTRERELIFDAGSYEERSTHSYRLPGILLDSLKLTL
ncbi:MAG: metallopeptidase TldD-related protein [Chromatiales bacterium]